MSGWKDNEAPVRRVVLPQITAALGAPLPVQCAMPCPPLTEDSFQDLLARFAAVRDPRHPRGIRHHVQAILAIAAVAVICGAGSLRRSGSGPATHRSGSLRWLVAAGTNCSAGSWYRMKRLGGARSRHSTPS